MSNNIHSKNIKLSPQQATNGTITPSTPTMLGKIRGKSIKILVLLEKEPSRSIELGESLDYPVSYVWKYLKRLQKYGLVREQDYIWFLTDFGASFVFPFLKNYVTTIKTRHEIDTTRQKLDTKNKLSPKQISLAFWQPKYALDETASRVVEVMLEHYNTTLVEGKAQLGYTYPAHYDKWDVAKEFEITIDEVDEINRVLQNQGIGFLCRSYEGRLKRAFFKKWIAMRILEQKLEK